ncbi:aldolase/citrate lyase family protein [Acetivibrio sp. MSJd-27]|uniref:aldolase/citrate lyase family protein n=1 Tax=Acetivibrio sp. MSJd-27 TaxID=2841523 RepID=UPI001C1244FB|nr:aldolase/citrate lyase family protein [Acetivibrio sp. MSJd-27]MBU5450136.1 aldolase [Acetivibrio sp. MSJd-27]
MSLKLMYITNHPVIADIAQKAGVDILFVDMEYMGKDVRQHGLNTVKNHHTFHDIKAMKDVIVSCKNKKSELMVRVNPIHKDSEYEINTAIEMGADIIMLPMWKTIQEIQTFIQIIRNKAKVFLLLETKEAVKIIDDVISLSGIDAIHIGLNDLHLAYKNYFMFEPLANGLVDFLAKKIQSQKIDFGFGGIARIGEGIIPAEKILAEHVRLDSKMVILSRSFCDLNHFIDIDLDSIQERFVKGVDSIRKKEKEFMMLDDTYLIQNHNEIKTLVEKVVQRKRI